MTFAPVRRILIAVALAVACFVGVMLATMIIGALLRLTPDPAQEQFILCGLFLAFAAAIASFCYRIDTEEGSLLFGRWRVAPVFYVYAVLCALAIRGLSLAPSIRLPADLTGAHDWYFDRVGRDTTGAIITVLFLGALIPVIEEVIFRRGLYNLLAHIRPWVGVWGSAIVFAAVHPKNAMGGAFLLGIATAYLYARSRSVWPSIACHATANISAVAAALALSQP